MAIFKNGYVRKQNGAYCPYPINKRYRQNVQHTTNYQWRVEN